MTTVTDRRITPSFEGAFVADEEHLRLEFDHALGTYLHERRGGWDIASITDVLDFVGEHVPRARLVLTPQPDGRLVVAISFELPGRTL